MVFQLDRHLAAIDTAIGKRRAEDEGLARRTEILTSIPGVSRVTAAGLLTQMPELGRLDAKTVASLAGLTPVTRQSGAWQCRSFIHGGLARARRLLYMPALAAIRYHPDLCAKCRQLAVRRSDTWILRSGPSGDTPRLAVARLAGIGRRGAPAPVDWRG